METKASHKADSIVSSLIAANSNVGERGVSVYFASLVVSTDRVAHGEGGSVNVCSINVFRRKK